MASKFIVEICAAPDEQAGTPGGWDFIQSDMQTSDDAVADVKMRYPDAEVVSIYIKLC